MTLNSGSETLNSIQNTFSSLFQFRLRTAKWLTTLFLKFSSRSVTVSKLGVQVKVPSEKLPPLGKASTVTWRESLLGSWDFTAKDIDSPSLIINVSFGIVRVGGLFFSLT